MDDFGLTFTRSGFLWLLLLVPLLWWAARRALPAMGPTRGLAAFGLRALLVALFVLALAGTQTRRSGRAVAVVYLLDQSLSIPAAEREAMFQYVARDVELHRDAARRDRAGVIVFGREAAVEVPPAEDDLSWLRRSEALVPHLAEATDLSAALRLALSVFPPDCSRRVVIVTDGNENLGKAREVAPQLADEGIGIDVVPVHLTLLPDVAVEKIVLPALPKKGETVDARVVIVNDAIEEPGGAGGAVAGTLRITRRAGSETETLSEQEVVLSPGKNVLSMVHTLDMPPGFYTYEAQFFPRGRLAERTQRNNRATAFTNLRGKGRVLLIENVDTPGQFALLVERLRRADMAVDVRTSAGPFSSLAELQSYDTVILADVPRISGSEAEVMLSDDQVEALVRNTEMGCGLVMLGGPNSFGAGGWANTRLEEASPVDFKIKNLRVVPSGALALVIDKSGSMAGEKIMMSRKAGSEAARLLGAKDHIGVVAFDGAFRWVVPMQQIGPWRDEVVRRIRGLGADGGTNMFPGMNEAFQALRPVQAAVKHTIVLSDGQTQPGDFNRLARQMRQANITVSTVAVGADADRKLLADVARQGGGKFYQVTSPRAIPRIFMKEAMRVARPLVYERETGFSPRVTFPHEMLRGIEDPLPPITGYVLTSVKENPLVEVALRCPQPADEQTSTLLASWNYGLGRFVVLTTDAGSRWAGSWTGWGKYDALFTQIVRWSMRPRDQEGDFLVAAEYGDGKIRAVVTALDEDREFLNFLGMTGSVMTPELTALDMPMQQTAPGRYVGELAVDQPGNYFLAINTGRGRGTLRTGVSVPYSAEFGDKETNGPLLKSLAWQKPAGGEPGVLIHGNLLEPEQRDLAQFNTFRPTLAPAVAFRDVWPLLALTAACVLFLDVLNRRVAIDLVAALAAAVAWLRRRPAEMPPQEAIERLRSRKAALGQQIEQQRAALRFEAPPDRPATTPVEEPLTGSSPSAAPSAGASVAAAEEEEPSYTSRLLKAKRRMQQRCSQTGDREPHES